MSAFAEADGTTAAAEAASGAGGSTKKPHKRPQEALNEFWDGLITKTPGKVFQIFPRSLYANLLPPIKPEGAASKKNAATSYEQAAAECRDKVRRAVKECQRTNEKFTDPDFDIENDWYRNCLDGLPVPDSNKGGSDTNVGADALKDALSTLVRSNVLGKSTVHVDVAALKGALEDDDDDDNGGPMYPPAVHRLDWIFDQPSFLVDGFSSSDVQQGANGDCWWVAAVANLCSMPALMDKVCVERNEECGVYGFVFYRDGEWISTVIDDNLYLR
jgi:Calpain family cysteine protease